MIFALESITWFDLNKNLPKKKYYGKDMIVSIFTKKALAFQIIDVSKVIINIKLKDVIL